MKIRIKKVPQQAELNARKWKHGDGGYLYDGESEDTQQMNVANSYPMSLQDYIAQRIQDTRDSAANVMNTREYPKVYFNSSPDYINKYINDTKTAIRGNENLIAGEYQKLYRGQAKGAEKYSYDAIERARKNIEGWRNNIDLVLKYGKAPEGATCIFTVTDSYGNKRAVPGNMSWLAKGKSGRPIYEEKGFKLLKSAEPIQGDIIQMVTPVVSEGSTTLAPVHAYMYMGESEEGDKNYGEYLVKGSYSNGDFGKDAMRRNSPIWYNPSIDNLFRFVGNAADSARWTKEYNELMQNGPIVEKALGGRLFDEGGDTDEEYYPIWLDGITVKPSGNRPTTRDDWNWANWRELENERIQNAAESVRRGIDRNGTPIAAGIFGLAAAPFAIEGLGSSAVANSVRTGLQAMNTAFTPSTWLNPVTGTKLLSPTVGTIADAGIQGAFAYEGLNGLYNQGREGTLLSDPASTFMHGLEVLPLVGLGSKAVGMGADAWNKSGMKALWDISRNDVPVNIESSVAPRVIEYVPKVEPRARLDFLERNPSRISEAERAGVPKGDRNLKTIDRPNRWFPEITEGNAHRVSDAQWDDAFDYALSSGNWDEVNRLNDLHFYAKSGNTPIETYRGVKGKTYKDVESWHDVNWTVTNPLSSAEFSVLNDNVSKTFGQVAPLYMKYRNPKIIDYQGASWLGRGRTFQPFKDYFGRTMNIKLKDPSLPYSDPIFLKQPDGTNRVLVILENGTETTVPWSRVPYEQHWFNTRVADMSNTSVDKAFNEGHDAAILKNIREGSERYIGTDYVPENISQLKSAMPITYDLNGNMIPLSRRHDFSNPAIEFANGGPLVEYAMGGKLFGDGGYEQNELSIGNIGFFNHPLLSLKYYGSPQYDQETPFTVAFTDAIIKDKDAFMWNGKMYSTDIDWNKKFEKDANGNIPFQEFANYMYPAVIKILKEKGLPLTNAHNIVRQAGLESQYGTNPVSGKGYNLSGIKWNSKTMGNYNHATNSKDNLEYVDFDNLKDYLEFKIDLLNNRYDAINAENDKDFVDRLHQKSSGINKKGFDYSTNYKGYLNMLLNTKSLDKWLKQLYTPVITRQDNQ